MQKDVIYRQMFSSNLSGYNTYLQEGSLWNMNYEEFMKKFDKK